MSRFDVVEIPPQLVAVVRRKVPMNELTGFFGAVFSTVAAAGRSLVGMYWSEPTGDPSTWQTRIVWPLREVAG